MYASKQQQQQAKWEKIKGKRVKQIAWKRRKFLKFKHKDNFTAAFHTILDLN